MLHSFLKLSFGFQYLPHVAQHVGALRFTCTNSMQRSLGPKLIQDCVAFARSAQRAQAKANRVLSIAGSGAYFAGVEAFSNTCTAREWQKRTVFISFSLQVFR